MKDLGQLACETLMFYKKLPISLLLVEDNPNDAELARHEIRDCAPNCIVEHVSTGEAAIATVKTIADRIHQADPNAHQFDVALVDLLLPGKSGIESADIMTAFAPLLVVFICSGAQVPERAMQTAIDKGFAILPKPLRRAHVEMIMTAVKSAKEKAAIDPAI